MEMRPAAGGGRGHPVSARTDPIPFPIIGNLHGWTTLTDRFDRALGDHVHSKQTRKGTIIPYIAHLLAVAATVLEYGGDEDLAIAALLHDGVED